METPSNRGKAERFASVRLARNAMATRFEIVLHGENESFLRAAGEEALDEIERLESQLSLYRPSSEIARVNARAAREPVRVSPPVFKLLKLARQLRDETQGAFDITIAPLVRCWGFMGGTGRWPDPVDLAEAQACVGMQQVILSEEDFTIRFDHPGVMLDLGAIGKGYAIDCAVMVLREAGIASALIHGGTSTVYAMGKPFDADAWKIAIEPPSTDQPEAERPALLAKVTLQDQALSVSAVWGRSFERDGKNFGHVLDPRTGQPVSSALLSAVALPSATESDALSTALLVLGGQGHPTIAALRPAMRTLLVTPEGAGFKAEARGIPLRIDQIEERR